MHNRSYLLQSCQASFDCPKPDISCVGVLVRELEESGRSSFVFDDPGALRVHGPAAQHRFAEYKHRRRSLAPVACWLLMFKVCCKSLGIPIRTTPTFGLKTCKHHPLWATCIPRESQARSPKFWKSVFYRTCNPELNRKAQALQLKPLLSARIMVLLPGASGGGWEGIQGQSKGFRVQGMYGDYIGIILRVQSPVSLQHQRTLTVPPTLRGFHGCQTACDVR